MSLSQSRSPAWILPLAAVAIAAVLPAVLTDFRVFLVTQILTYAIAILGLNVLTGFNGQISLGHGAFYAVGSYVAAILMMHYEVPYWLAVPIAGIVSFAVGFLFGLPALRLEGHYLALATFALALAVPQLLKHETLEPWTSGVQGLFVLKPEAPFGLPINADQWMYYLCLAATVVLFVAARNLLNGRIGRALMAIRDNPFAAEAMGVNANIYKAAAFGISAFYTGIAGALSALAVQFVAPDSFTMYLSIYLVVGLVVGGVGAIPGAFFGAAFIVLMPNVAAGISKAATGAVFGVMLIIFMWYLPDGVWGGLRRLLGRFSRRRAATQVAPAE